MIQLKLFLDNAEDILTQVKGLNIPIHDCIHLRDCPLTAFVEGVDDTDYFDSDKERKSFEGSRSEENITCVYISRIFIENWKRILSP